MRVVRGDLSWDINCPIPPAHCLLGLLACSEAYEFGQLGTGLSWFLHVVRRMSLDSWALGCPGSKQMSSFKRTNGIPERRS